MRKRLIIISMIIIITLLFNLPYGNNSIDNKNYIANYESSYYLDHNLTIGNTSNYILNSQNIIVFKNNINIIDYGIFKLYNSSIITNHTKLSLKICNATFIMQNSFINATGQIYFYNSSIIIKNSQIVNKTTLFIKVKDSSIILQNSTINYGPLKQFSSNFTSNILYNKNVPQDAPGSIPFNNVIYYPNSYVNKLNIHFKINGDNNGTGDLLFYEHGSLIKNLSIPVYLGTYYYNVTIKLPRDLLPNNFSNYSYFYVKVPTDSSPYPHPAGEDGNITFCNITMKAYSNDTESYYNLSSYNIIFINSKILSCKSNFNTNFRNYYIYQNILNPYKKSIMLYNSSFYSISSYFGSGIYYNSPFHNFNSSTFIYGIKTIYFTNGYNYFNLNYDIIPKLFNSSMDITAIYYNNLINSKIEIYNNSNILLFSIQNNSKIVYYGDYYAKVGRQIFNFSFAPIPDFYQDNKVYFNVKMAEIKYNYSVPSEFIAFKNNKIKVNITSLYYSSNVKLSIFLNDTVYCNRNMYIRYNTSKSLCINILNNETGIFLIKISIEIINNNYSFSGFINKTIKLDFVKDVDISIKTSYSYVNGYIIINSTLFNYGENNITSKFVINFYDNSTIIKKYNFTLKLNSNSYKGIYLKYHIYNVTSIGQSYYNYSNSMNVSDKLIQDISPAKNYTLYILTSLSGIWKLDINNKIITENTSNISLNLMYGHYNITIIKSGYEDKYYNIDLNSNQTIIVSMVKINKNSYLPYIYIGITGAITSLSLFTYFYSFKTIKCPNCGTKYFKNYDKCPVCLYERKNKK